MSCKLNNRDCSITQFAVIDDENVSALQQVTRGGGGKFLTLIRMFVRLTLTSISALFFRNNFSESMEITV